MENTTQSQNTKTQKHKNTKTQKHKNTKTQKHKNTKTQKHKNKHTDIHHYSEHDKEDDPLPHLLKSYPIQKDVGKLQSVVCPQYGPIS
jgi:hypothetical protein